MHVGGVGVTTTGWRGTGFGLGGQAVVPACGQNKISQLVVISVVQITVGAGGGVGAGAGATTDTLAMGDTTAGTGSQSPVPQAARAKTATIASKSLLAVWVVSIFTPYVREMRVWGGT